MLLQDIEISLDDPQKTLAKYTEILALTEIRAGAFARYLPFSFLNQIFLLSRCAVTIPPPMVNRAPFLISSIAALMKGLSQGGKKLSPMVALCMQGLLFNIGFLLFGKRALGLLMGCVLASVWGSVQIGIVMTLFFGGPFYKILMAYSLFKMVASIAVSFLSMKISEERFRRYTDIFRQKKMDRGTKPLKIVLNAVIETAFVFSLGYFLFSFELIKPIVFYFAWAILNQLVPTQRWVKFLAKKFPSVQQTYQDIKAWKK